MFAPRCRFQLNLNVQTVLRTYMRVIHFAFFPSVPRC